MKICRFVGMSLVACLAIGTLMGTTCPLDPGTTVPTEFTNADTARGGALYDKWWNVTGVTAAEPTGNHARYPTAGGKSGADTHRCKECHGWDYMGKDGAYASGSHFTGIIGIFGTTKTAQEVFDEIKTAHGFGTAGLSDSDIWDLAKFVLATDGAQFDTRTIIDSSKSFNTGNATTGATLFSSGIAGGMACATVGCHGADGKERDFHNDPTDPEYVGGLAKGNPWEFQHKVRFGHPGTAMPSAVTDGGTTQDVADVGAHAQTLD